MSRSTPSTTRVSATPDEHRILLLRPALVADSASGERTARDSRQAGGPQTGEDTARHYLKFMLPSIPIAAFILTFVLCEVLLGLQSAAIASAAHIVPPHEDPTMPLVAAALVSVTTGMLCMWIYSGFLRIALREHAVR